MGIVKLLVLLSFTGCTEEASDGVRAISGGISSGAGIGSSRAAATS